VTGPALSTWQLHTRLMRFRPWLYAANVLIWSANGIARSARPGDQVDLRRALGQPSGRPRRLDRAGADGRDRAWAHGQRPVGTYTFASIWQSIASLLIRNLMQWLVVAPGTRQLPDAPGEVVNRFRDDSLEVLRYLDQYVDLGGAVVFIAVGLTIMISISPLATAIAILPLIGVLLLTRLVGSRLRGYRRLSREAAGQVSHFVGELFGAAQAVKVASAEERAMRHFDRLNETRPPAALKDRLFGELLRSVSANMASIGIGAVLLLGATSTATLTIGDFALFVSYLSRMTQWSSRQPGRRPAQAGPRLVRPPDRGARRRGAGRAGQRRPDLRHARPAPLPAIERRGDDRLERLEVRGLTGLHPTTGRGVADVDLTIERGTLTVVTGRVGAGKTTLLRALLG